MWIYNIWLQLPWMIKLCESSENNNASAGTSWCSGIAMHFNHKIDYEMLSTAAHLNNGYDIGCKICSFAAHTHQGNQVPQLRRGVPVPPSGVCRASRVGAPFSVRCVQHNRIFNYFFSHFLTSESFISVWHFHLTRRHRRRRSKALPLRYLYL